MRIANLDGYSRADCTLFVWWQGEFARVLGRIGSWQRNWFCVCIGVEVWVQDEMDRE